MPGGFGAVVQTWDEENPAVTAADGTVSTHTYSGDGHRQRVAVTPAVGTPSSTGFVWDGDNVLHEIETDGTLTYYTEEPGVPGGLISRRNTGSGGTTPATLWYCYDPSNKTRHLFDHLGVIVESYLYDAFGNLVTSTGTGVLTAAIQVGGMDPGYGGATATVLGSLRLFGKQHGYQSDHAANDRNRLYVRARHYDAATGRWMSRDPLGDVDGPNLYAYCGNDGVNAVDPHGMSQIRGQYRLYQGTGSLLADLIGSNFGVVGGHDLLTGASDFAAGAGDSLTLGLTAAARSGLGVDNAVHKTSGYYIAGETTEVAVEIVASGGSAALKHAAERAIVRKMAERGVNRTVAKRLLREESETQIKKNFTKDELAKGTAHHNHPLLGHPLHLTNWKARQTLFPTIGLPARLNGARRNISILKGPVHDVGHLRLMKQEKALIVIVNRFVVPARIATDIYRPIANSK